MSVRRKRWVPGRGECDIHGTGARRGSVEKLLTPSDALRQTVLARAPLAAMVGYASALRSLTAGEASLSMEFSHYARVEPAVLVTNAHHPRFRGRNSRKRQSAL